MAEPFAKLFDTARGQLLVVTDTKDSDGDYGPCLTVRSASSFGVTPQIILGPWSDDTAGWDHVEKLLADFDQAQADDWAEKFNAMLASFAGDAS